MRRCVHLQLSWCTLPMLGRMTTENTLFQSLSAISEWRAFVHYHTWLGRRQRSMVLWSFNRLGWTACSKAVACISRVPGITLASRLCAGGSWMPYVCNNRVSCPTAAVIAVAESLEIAAYNLQRTHAKEAMLHLLQHVVIFSVTLKPHNTMSR